MKSYTSYKNIERPYFNLSEFIGFPVFPIAAASALAFIVLFFFGVTPMLLLDTGISIAATFIYNGLKNASPNGSRNSTSIGLSSLVTSVIPAFFVIAGVLLTVDVGLYIIVTFLKTGVFYAGYFYVWLFVMFALPVLYLLSIELKYQFQLYYQVYYFTPLPLNIVHDYELVLSDVKVSFLQTKKKFISDVVAEIRKDGVHIGKLNSLTVLERNECLYEPVFNETVYIPKDTDRLKVSWYSAIEGTYYDGEINFPFDKLSYVENKYPLDMSKFLRGKKTDRVTLAILQGGKIQLFNKYQNLLEPVFIGSAEVNEKKKQQQLISLSSAYAMKKMAALINTLKQSNAIGTRAELADYLCSWQITGSGLEGHNIEIKDVRNNYTTSAPLALNTFEQRHLPIFFEIDYHKLSWLYIHIDAEKLYSLIQSLTDKEPAITFDFYLDLEKGEAELRIKNKDKVLPFAAWEKKVIAHHWKEAKDVVLANKDFKNKNNFLKEIGECIVAQDYVMTEELCKSARKQYPYFPMIYFYEARLLWYAEGFEASYAQESYFLEKTRTDPYALAQIYNHYGCLYDEQNRYAESLACFEKAYASYPTVTLYLSNIAEMHYKLKDAKKALQYAEECIKKEFTSDMIEEIIAHKGVQA